MYLRNVSSWIYPVSTTVDGGAESYGPTVNNLTNGGLNGPQRDATAFKEFTFPHGSGTHTITYVVKAGTENDLYVGLPAGEVTEFEVDACAPPTAVLNPTATAAVESAVVTWAAPGADGGLPITGYTVTASPGGASVAVGADDDLSASFDDLTAGTEYTFSVVATNAAGDGPAGTAAATPLAVPAQVPGAPVVSATASQDSVMVTWTAPAANGAAITGYTVTAAPGGESCTVAAGQELECEFDDLTSGTQYTFSVVATNAAGNGSAGTATATPIVIEEQPGFPDYNPVGPLRLFDTRGVSDPVLVDVPVAQVGGATVLEVQVTGHAGAVPADGAGAVSLNVTATNTSGPGFVTVYPCATAPEASNVNYSAAGTTVANAVITPLSATGTVCFYSLVPVDLVVDVNGWFLDDERAFEPVTPTRVFDTRGQSDDVLTDLPVAQVAAGESLEVILAGLGDNVIPATGVKGVALNVTATNTSGPGFVTVYPCGELGDVSNVNFTGADQTVPNAVITPLSDDGKLCFYASTAVDLVVDITGWLSDGSTFESVDPVRVFDTRGQSPEALRTVPVGRIGGAQEVRVKVTDLGTSVPATGVGAVSLNVTATDTTAPGYVTVYPCGERGDISSVNFTDAGQTVANAVIAPVSADGEVCFYALVGTHLVVDLNGWTALAPYAEAD